MMPSGVAKMTKLDLDRSARTVLPIDFKGRELKLEARAYQGKDEQMQAMALINRGEGTAAKDIPLVRVHSGCVTGDIFHSLRCDCRAQLECALDRISKTPNGVLIYLPYQEGRGIGLFNKIKAYALQDQGLDTVDANIELGEPIDAREYELAGEILQDLGFSKIRLMTNNPAKMDALKAEGIEVVEQVSLVVTPSEHNERYLETKRRRMSHKI
jgi:GTP cyclohydrolase II